MIHKLAFILSVCAVTVFHHISLEKYVVGYLPKSPLLIERTMDRSLKTYLNWSNYNYITLSFLQYYIHVTKVLHND